ncbi:MAG: SH3 domain-containing protein, partial [Rhodospirillales bacterium]|nr:SH3 domain-containing protein [Rhodospirillales bacterium]
MRILTLSALVTLLLFIGYAITGQMAEAEDFMGHEIESGPGTYIVLRDVNVRSKPKTDSKRIKGLKKGNRVQSTGQYMGWVSIVEDGKSVGFAYKKFLLPLIDGSLKEKITGTVKKSGRFECEYT